MVGSSVKKKSGEKQMVHSYDLIDKIPNLSINAGPLDAKWTERLKEEFAALIQLVKLTKDNECQWFDIKPQNKECTKWSGTCWFIYEFKRFEFKLEFEIPALYPKAPIDFYIKELDGKTVKMYHGGKICQSAHFHPLWVRHAPYYGIVHALSHGLSPWLATEVPDLASKKLIQPI